MCFIKVGDPLAPCEHEECKKTLEAFKISNCMHQYPMQAFKPHPLSHLKRQRPCSPHGHSEVAQDILKKMKFDKEEVLFNSNENSENVKNLLNSSAGFQSFQPSMPNFNLLVHASPSTSQYPMMNACYNKQPQVQVPMTMYPSYNGNNGFNESMLNLQLRMKCNNGAMPMAANACQEKDQGMEKHIIGILVSQNNLLMEMNEKTSCLTQALGKIIHDFEDLQKTVSLMATEKNIEQELKREMESHQADVSIESQNKFMLSTTSEISKSEELIKYLYVNKSQNFKYSLVQSKCMELPLYRERNFSFSVVLKDSNNKEVFHTNRIPLSIAIYTYENPPKCVDTNTAGQKILKGLVEKDLVNGNCSFDKIQVKEVTSHFRKGKIFIVVYPKMPTFGNFPQDSLVNSYIDYTTIRPLVIENVVVKAKKLPNFLKKLKRRQEEKSSIVSASEEKVSIFEDI